jgi:hypothetical protein
MIDDGPSRTGKGDGCYLGPRPTINIPGESIIAFKKYTGHAQTQLQERSNSARRLKYLFE